MVLRVNVRSLDFLGKVVQEKFHFGMDHVFDLLFGLFAVPTNKALKRSTNSHPLTREKLAHVSGSGQQLTNSECKQSPPTTLFFQHLAATQTATVTPGN